MKRTTIWAALTLAAALTLTACEATPEAGSPAPSGTSSSTPAAEPAAEKVAPTYTVPDFTGMSGMDAILAHTTAIQAGEGYYDGFALDFPDANVFMTDITGDVAGGVVTSQSPAAGTVVSVMDPAPSIVLAAAGPVGTMAQKNAVAKAQSYLKYAGFSRTGLIDQLQYEGFSPEDSTYGADNAGADWLAEAAEKAQSYMDTSAFSRDGLAEQLQYEGFTPEEVAAGLAAVGY